MADLTEKQKRFCDYYIETGNATEAYKKAYKNNNQRASESNGSRLLSNDKVKNYIDERLKQIESKRIADAKEVMEYLTKILRNQEQEEVVIVSENGPEIIKKDVSIKDRNKAAELLGKRYALWTEKIDLDGNVGVTIIDDVGNLNDG
ncbi:MULTISPECIES: terminase small subunit [unclassified Clostridioides]|uniref:terminase small subunit n=1 Tax=unclassified Clostridioides TaxID=2635829 RepID=UPI001D122E90|nr:terminase small subunit [Clostridioides sp. ZZV15-6388]MCC0660392.1 terminase small subunit [Clostridioides sp. ZZV14-6154]MCC0719061.1 terminase small subunit [Clostridioides sp. ZZV14-6105]MCC0720806.1 terminase small subunit [Clostridioides sp. ZZV14-6104]MCC0725242.1 terminase small subunit [Clostridioides sp. ZZV14-6045]MCC0741385.1 terminase small subunit [Clostridioides sp. ZZV14-6044]MCC0752761.1 terminase small subunit [Clostridioides sp. ZZV13-5731]